MTAQPQWSPVDEPAGSLLDLLADDGTVSADHEWDLYVQCLYAAAIWGTPPDHIDPNHLRDLIAGQIKPQRVGAFTHRALSQGLIEYTGQWVTSTDRRGKNAGKPARELRWLG